MDLKWHTFLVDGFEDWRGAATIAAFQTVKPDPQAILQSMITHFLFPEGVKQSDEDIEAALEQIAIAHNARYRDPKTGKVIGTIRDVKRRNKPAPQRQPAGRRFGKKQGRSRGRQ